MVECLILPQVRHLQHFSELISILISDYQCWEHCFTWRYSIQNGRTFRAISENMGKFVLIWPQNSLNGFSKQNSSQQLKQTFSFSVQGIGPRVWHTLGSILPLSFILNENTVKIPFLTFSLCGERGSMPWSRCRVWGRLCGVSFLLSRMGSRDYTQVIRLGGMCLCTQTGNLKPEQSTQYTPKAI